MMEHFCHGNAMVLCDLDRHKTNELIKNCDHDTLENVRHLMSFRKLVESESYENRIKLLTDDNHFRLVLKEEIIKIQKYIRRLHIFLECLLILVADLPQAPLGKQVIPIKTKQIFLVVTVHGVPILSYFPYIFINIKDRGLRFSCNVDTF